MIIQFGYMLNIFQKLNKCVYHFRENNWLYVLPVMKVELLRKN